MNEIVELIMGLLCPGSSLYSCQQFVSGYEGPVLQLLWLIFFPMIFITFLVVILSSAVTSEHTKFKVLIGMGAIMFIIVQGYWQFVLTLSKMWWFALIVLGGLWAFTKKMGPEKNAAGQRSSSTLPRSWLTRGVFGDRGLNPFEGFGNARQIDQKITVLKDEIRVLEDRKKMATGDKEKSSYSDRIAVIEQEINGLQHMKKAWKSPSN